MYGEPELRHLRTFVVVARELHFTRAAQRLHIAQQALSAQIRHLEDMLGVRLFVRTTRKVELTDAGRTLLEHAEPLLAAASRAWEEVARADAGELGQVRLSYSPTAKREILPHVLPAVHARYPDLKVQMLMAWRGNEAVGDDIIDIAITRAPAFDDADVETLPLRASALGIILAEHHPLAGEGGIAADQLAAELLMLSPRALSPAFYDLIVSALQGRGWSGPVEEFENMGSDFLMGNPDALARIASGEAFGVGFEGQYPELAPGLAWRAIVPPLRLPLQISWRRGARTSVRNVVDVALEVARERGWLAPGKRPAAA